MIAYFKVERNAGEAERILRVDGVRDLADAVKIVERIRAVHADVATLMSIEPEALRYTTNEILTEKNLLGGPRRYSTGSGTVTIPENA